MSCKIDFKKSVARDLKKIDKDQAGRILQKIETELPLKAETPPALTGRFAGLRKFRIGDYRVVFTIIGDTTVILRIKHRRDAYK